MNLHFKFIVLMLINEEKVNRVYKNNIGISFTIKREYMPYEDDKINLVFNTTALRLNDVELEIFLQDIESAVAKPLKCKCENPKDCKSILVETPLEQLSLAMSYNELLQMKDLIKGTLFQIELNYLLREIL